MKWRDIRFEKPTEADADSNGMTIQLLENGRIGQWHWSNTRQMIAWMSSSDFPPFVRIPDPPKGWRLVDKNEPVDPRAKYWDRFSNEWQQRLCPGDAWIETDVYIVPKAPKLTSEDYHKGHKACGLKVGDHVKVTRKAKDKESGWNNSWHDDMHRYVGKTAIIIADHGISGFRCALSGDRSGWGFPFFILEKVATKIRPFENAAEFHPHCEKWISRRKEDGSVLDGQWRAVGFDDIGIWTVARRLTYKEFLNEYKTFADGTPIGIEE
jgi:hypothetical protein